jgi:hypothetical protein
MIFGGLIFSGIAIGQIFGIIKIDMWKWYQIEQLLPIE